MTGSTATFTVLASRTDGGTLTYQWQFSTDSGSNWSSVTSGTGATSNSYTTLSLVFANNGYKYRVIVTNSINGTTASTTSDSVTLTVNKSNVATFSALSISPGSISAPVTTGNTITYKVAVTETVTTIAMRPTLSSAFASLTLNTTAVGSTPYGSTSVASQSKSLVAGLNTFNFVVTAENGVDSRIYTILVTRATSTAKVTAVPSATPTPTPSTTPTPTFKVAATRAPRITGSPSPASAAVGVLITLNGSGFTGIKTVRLGNVAAITFTVVSDTQLTFLIPAGATTGSATVTNSAGSASSGRITVTG